MLLRHVRHRARTRSRAQALVELALVMPLLLGIVAVLFQYAILFMSYLTLIHMTRDAGRWLAVHPNSSDTQVLAYVVKDLPTSVMLPASAEGPNARCTYDSVHSTWSCVTAATSGTTPTGGIYVNFSPTCGTLDATTSRCMTGSAYSRPSGAQQTLSITYDASSRIFLTPLRYAFGGFLKVTIPGSLQSYTYKIMVEPE